MKISAVFFLAIIILFNPKIQAQKEISINYFRPYQYDAARNTVKAWIDQKDLGQDFIISLDGKAINYDKNRFGKSGTCITSGRGRLERW